MPGLVGFTLGSVPSERAQAVLESMRDAMHHQDTYSVDTPLCDAALCATRCHTATLQPEPQPWVRDDISVWLDGEFYNRRELDPQATADPQLLLSLYQEDAALKRLEEIDGLYTAVIYDAPAQQLHLVSDRCGLRPLYWTDHRGNLAWASEAKALLHLPAFEVRIDRRALDAFLNIGYLYDNLTWFEGMQRLPAACVLTWDLRTHSSTVRHYWSWEKIAPVTEPNEDDLAAELGQRFTAAVRRRCRPTEEVGLVLSGGLDSRAILAALPDAPFSALTFGLAKSPDSRIASRVAHLKGMEHHCFDIDAGNWLAPRLAGVWWTDGMLDILHMHSIEALERIKSLFAICLNGAGGDGLAGGGHLFAPDELVHHLEYRLGVAAHAGLLADLESYFARLGSAHAFYVDHRMRCFSLYGLLMGTFHGLEYRLPFMDNDFQEMLYAAPDSLKRGNRLYRKMLLGTFPQFYRSIPWQATGVPIAWPTWAGRALRAARRIGRRSNPSFVDYYNWIRQEPARSLIGEILHNPTALYPEYLPREEVRRAWEEHGEQGDRSAALGRYLTFEVLLQQVFEGKWRPST